VRSNNYIKLKQILLFIFCILLLHVDFVYSADSSSCDEQERCMPSSINLGDYSYSIFNSTLYRFWGFKVYSAGLYLLENNSTGEVVNERSSDIFDNDFALRLVYHRKLKQQDFLKSATKILDRNPEWDIRRYGSLLNEFSSFISDVSAGDSYAMFFNADKEELTLVSNDTKILTRVNDRKFAEFYLGIWLGSYAVKEEQRQDLLKGL
jgi:hypothetical protein